MLFTKLIYATQHFALNVRQFQNVVLVGYLVSENSSYIRNERKSWNPKMISAVAGMKSLNNLYATCQFVCDAALAT